MMPVGGGWSKAWLELAERHMPVEELKLVALETS